MSTAAILTNSVRARYANDYVQGALSRRVYDLLCYPIAGGDKDIMQRSTSIVTPYLSAMGISASTISETTDITPQTLRDTTATLTPTSRADAIQDSELLLNQSYVPYAAKRHELVGENMMATIEALNMDYSLCGDNVQRIAARASLDAGTTTHYLNDKEFFKAGNALKEMRCPSAVDVDGIKVPSGHIAIVPPDAYVDLVLGGNVISALQYQDKQALFNGEIGELGGFRIIVSPYAKVFGGAGATNGGGDAAYTLGAAANALAESLSAADIAENSLTPDISRLWEVCGDVALAVAQQAIEDGVARQTDSDSLQGRLDEYRWRPAYPEIVLAEDSR